MMQYIPPALTDWVQTVFVNLAQDYESPEALLLTVRQSSEHWASTSTGDAAADAELRPFARSLLNAIRADPEAALEFASVTLRRLRAFREGTATADDYLAVPAVRRALQPAQRSAQSCPCRRARRRM